MQSLRFKGGDSDPELRTREAEVLVGGTSSKCTSTPKRTWNSKKK